MTSMSFGVTCSESIPHTACSSAHLGMLEDVHDEDGKPQAKDVGCKAGVEVGVGVLLQAWRRGRGERGGLDAGIPSDRGVGKTLEAVGCLRVLGREPGGRRALWYCPSYVSLDKLLSFFQPWFTYLQNETTGHFPGGCEYQMP